MDSADAGVPVLYRVGQLAGAACGLLVVALSSLLIARSEFVHPLLALVPVMGCMAVAAAALGEPGWLVPIFGVSAPMALYFLAGGSWIRLMGLAHLGYLAAAFLMMRSEAQRPSPRERGGAM